MGARANLRTAVVIEQLPRGRWLAWPFADPELAQFGRPEDDPILVMSLVLPEHLKTLSGSAVAAFATPAGTALATTAVTLERLDQPPRLRRPITIAVPWITTPYGKDLWLHIPPLKLTLRVDDPDEIDALVTSEVQRVVAAIEPSADDLLRLFPAHGYRLAWIDVTLDGDDRDPRATTAKTIAAEEAHALLVSVATPMHADRRLLDGPPLVARPDALGELDRLIARHSVLVHGPELVGKTALIEGWLRARLATPDTDARRDPRALPPVLVYATSGARLMAGMSMLGQWQERLRRVLQALSTLSGVLWIEHLGELVGDSASGDELANALRPWLEDGRVRLVTELRDDEIVRLERRHPALLQVLRRVRLAPLGHAETLHVLASRYRHHRERDPARTGFAPAAYPELVALATRYQSHLALPGVAVRLGDDLDNLADAERQRDARVAPLGDNDVQRLYASLTGLPIWLLDDRRPFDPDATRAALERQVIGQDAAVGAVAESLALIKTRLAARGKPLASFLFAGPTGVGKTELARALAIHLFGSERRLVRFDMSEFMDATAAERLIRGGARDGGDGGGDAQRDGLLTRRLRREPLSVILLDEIEKAHASVFDLLLQALGDGRLTDASGRTASLEGAIVILTSNLGATDKVRRIGLVASDADSLAAHYLAAVRKHFAPELVNRLERIIPFAALGPAPLRKIVRLQVDRVRARRGLGDIELAVTDAALDRIAAQGTTAEYGARALRRAVDRLLVTPVAHTIAALPSGRVARIQVDVDATGAITLAPVERPASVTKDPLNKVSAMRREARALLGTGAVREVHDRLDHLDADLMRGAPAGPLLAERARLTTLLQPLQQIVAELEQVEDLLYMGTARPRVLTPAIEAELTWLQTRIEELETSYFELMTATEERKDLAIVAITELDDERGFDRWLVPLLEAAEARRWNIVAWIEGEHGERWPRDLGLGPPRTADELYIRIQERPTDFRHVVLGIHGRHAGTLLACEDGIIAFRAKGVPSCTLFVKVLSLLRATMTPEIMRDSELLGAPANELRGPMANGATSRLFTSNPSRLTLMAAGTSAGFPVDVTGYFATWEKYATRHLRAFDEHTTRDRSELFGNPLDDELMYKKLAREADALMKDVKDGGLR